MKEKMVLDILKHNVIARFAFRQMRQTIFKLLKEKAEDALTKPVGLEG